MAEYYTYIEFPDNENLTTDDLVIEMNSMHLSEILCNNSPISFGECNSNMFEVNILGIENIAGEKIYVYQKDIEDETAEEIPIFTGYVDSAKLNSSSTYRTVIAYDYMYTYGGIDVAEWWEDFWDNIGSSTTLGELRTSLLDYVGIEYEDITLLNDGEYLYEKPMDLSSISFKRMLIMLGQLNLCYPHFSRSGVLQFIQLPINVEGTDLTDNYILSNSSFEEYTTDTITGVVFYDSANNKAYTVGTSDNPYSITENILAYSMGTGQFESIDPNMMSYIPYVSYTPCSVYVINRSFDYKLGDYITTSNGNFYVMQNDLSGTKLLKQTVMAVGQQSMSATVTETDYITQKTNENVENLEEDVTSISQDVTAIQSQLASMADIRVYYQTDEPTTSTTFHTGDTWYKLSDASDTSSYAALYVWDGTQWVETAFDGSHIIRAGTITAAEIATNTITSNELASNSVTADKLVGNSITLAKLADDVTDAIDDAESNAVTTANTYTDSEIDSLSMTYSGTCSTSASTAAKVVTCEGFTLQTGATISVFFSTMNTYTSGALTLNVNDTGAKTISVAGTATSSSYRLVWTANKTITFTYTGTYWSVADAASSYRGNSCTVAGDTAAKTSSVNGGCVIMNGTTVTIPMLYGNTNTAPTLNFGGTGTFGIHYVVSSDTSTTTVRPTVDNGYSWADGQMATFTFTGNAWWLTGTTTRGDYMTFTSDDGLTIGQNDFNSKVNINSSGVGIYDENGDLTNQINSNGMTIYANGEINAEFTKSSMTVSNAENISLTTTNDGSASISANDITITATDVSSFSGFTSATSFTYASVTTGSGSSDFSQGRIYLGYSKTYDLYSSLNRGQLSQGNYFIKVGSYYYQITNISVGSSGYGGFVYIDAYDKYDSSFNMTSTSSYVTLSYNTTYYVYLAEWGTSLDTVVTPNYMSIGDFIPPTTAGTSGYVLTSSGSSSDKATWTMPYTNGIIRVVDAEMKWTTSVATGSSFGSKTATISFAGSECTRYKNAGYNITAQIIGATANYANLYGYSVSNLSISTTSGGSHSFSLTSNAMSNAGTHSCTAIFKVAIWAYINN